MSPKRLEHDSTNVANAIMDEDMVESPNPSDVAIITNLQSEIALQSSAASSSATIQDTPIKRQLRNELAEVVDVASRIQEDAERQTAEVKENACAMLRSVIGDQRQSFENTAADLLQSSKNLPVTYAIKNWHSRKRKSRLTPCQSFRSAISG